jgi:hypothetical protein
MPAYCPPVISNVRRRVQVHNNHRLSELALRNAQRSQLEELLRGCEASVRALWERKALTFHPETPISIATAYSRAGKIHDGTDASSGADARTFCTSSGTRARDWLIAELQALPAGEYLAAFGGANTISFGPSSRWVPNLPITRVTPQEVVAVLRASGRELPFDQLAIVAPSGSRSVVLDSYSGILPEEPSVQEIVYELTAIADAA